MKVVYAFVAMVLALTAASMPTTTVINATGDLNISQGPGTLYFYFDVPSTITSIQSARVSICAGDVDSPQERDKVYFNGKILGQLQGEDNEFEVNTFVVPSASVKIGRSNTMRIEVDESGQGWRVAIKYVKLILNGEGSAIELSASSGLRDCVNLSWDVNFSGTTYNVYRGISPETLNLYREGLSERHFTDTAVASGVTYYYQVMSKNGISSDVVDGRCQDGSITLLATTAYYHEIRLMWNPDNCEGPYTIYRGSRVDDLAPLAYGVNDMSYTDDSIGNGESFYYRVVAANGIVSDVVKGTGKQQEIEITYDPNIPDAIRLDWTTTGPAPEYYTIVRLNAEGEVNAVFENVTEPHYCDVTALLDQSYKYEVKFKDVEGSVNVKNSLKDFPKVDSWELIPDSDVEHPNKPLVAGDVASVDIKLREYDKLHYRVVAAALIGRKVVQTETYSNTNRKRNVKQPSPEGHLLLWISDEHKGDQNEILSLLGVNPIPTVWENDPNSTFKEGGLKNINKPRLGYIADTIHINGHLNSGKWEHHGNIPFTAKIVYQLKDDKNKSVYYTSKGKSLTKKVFFKKDANDSGFVRLKKDEKDRNGNDIYCYGLVPNWFTYWKKDKACSLEGVYFGVGNKYRGRHIPSLTQETDISQHVLKGNGNSVVNVPQYSRISFGCTSQINVYGGAAEYKYNGSLMIDGEEFADQRIYGISSIETTVAHEKRHGQTFKEYYAELQNYLNLNIPKLNRLVFENYDVERPNKSKALEIAIRELQKEFDSDVEYKPCNITAHEKFCRDDTQVGGGVVYFCDSLGNDQEKKLRETWRKGFDKDDVDTLDLGEKKEWEEYRTYGDDEYLSRLTERKLQKTWEKKKWKDGSVNGAQPANDWAYPGAQAGGIPAVSTTQTRKMLKAAGQTVESSAEDIAFRLLSVSGSAFESGVVYDMSINVSGPVAFRLVAFLRGADSNTTVRADVSLNQGDNSVQIVFPGDDIYSAGLVGPYQLDHVEVWTFGENVITEKVGNFVDFLIPAIAFDREKFEHKGAKWVGDVYDEQKTEDGLEVKTSLNVFVPGAYDIYAELSTTNGEAIAAESFQQELTQGTNEVSIVFANADIFSSRTDGPYAIMRLRLLKDGEPVHALGDVYITENEYRHADFLPSDAVVVADADSCVLELDEQSSEDACSDIVLRLDVMNESSQSLPYNVHVSLFAANDELVASFDRRYLYLTNGLNKVAAVFKSADVRAVGIDGPYHVKGVELRPSENGSNDATFRTRVESPAYKASDFAAASVAFSGETARVERADDSLVVAFDYETTRECTVVAAATLVDTNGNFVARAYSTNAVRRAGNWTAQLEFSWRDLAKENVGGPYRVAYFSLTPQGTGEESVVSDSLEIRDVNWLTPVAQQPIEVPEGVDWDSLFSWYVTDGKVVAGRYLGTNAHEVVVVPSEHNGQPVARIGSSCFRSNVTVKAVVVSDGIVDIGDLAFLGCESLKAVSLPESLEHIKGWAFSSCVTLDQIHLPDSLREIGNGAFYNATSLESLWIPPSVLDIPNNMCAQCSNLVMVAFPPVATNMGDYAFRDCPKLRSARVPEEIRVLPNGAFVRDLQLEDLMLPTTLEVISNNVVSVNDTLTDLVVPPGVTNIGDRAFVSCNALTNIVFRGAPPIVGNQPFPDGVQGCYSLDYREKWEAEIVDGRWNGLWMRPETLPKRRIDTDVIADEAVFEGEDWSFDWDGIREIQSLRNAPIGDGQQAGMTATLKGAGVIAFDWRTSCEGMAGDGSWRDHAEFLVDGEVVSMRADESLWSRYSFELVGDGDHTVTWRYVKDSSGSTGEDCVWVSDIQFAAISDEETSDELLDESEYNWFYENTLVRTTPENPFEYNPSVTPEEATCQVDIQSGFGVLPRSALQDAILEGVQAGICRVAEAVGLEYAVVTSDGWVMVGNANLASEVDEEVKASFIVDYSTTPSTIKYMISGHTLTNAEGTSTFVCAAQKTHVESLFAKSKCSCEIHSWAGKYDVVNADVQQVAPGTETELVAGLDTFQNETFQVSGGGTLVIPSDKIPAGGVRRRLHVDGNSAIKFDLSELTTIPTVLKLFNGVGSSFMVGSNMEVVVPGEGVDRVSKLFVKNGDLEARVAERPEIGDDGTQEEPFTVNVGGDSSTVSALVGNAVEGFWYGLLSVDLLGGDFLLDPDSVKQCTGTGPLRLESSANANGDSGFYRISVSADKP